MAKVEITYGPEGLEKITVDGEVLSIGPIRDYSVDPN